MLAIARNARKSLAWPDTSEACLRLWPSGERVWLDVRAILIGWSLPDHVNRVDNLFFLKPACAHNFLLTLG